jgi:CheY-like chemotaxis protein
MAHDILIVDDERDICTLIAGILEDEGHTARRAHNSSEAIDAWSSSTSGCRAASSTACSSSTSSGARNRRFPW